MFIIQNVVLLLARLLFMAIFLYFGLPKIKNLKKNAEDFEQMGFKPGMLFGTGVAVLEVVGGLMIGLGFVVIIPATLFVVHMLAGTIWKITKTDKKFSDWSYDLLLMMLALAFIFMGSGLFSLDALLIYAFFL